MTQNRLGSLTRVLLCLAGAFVTTEARAQFGPILSGAGAVNRSVGGVATGMPLSAAGALYWNPATMSGLGRSELDGGAELLFPRTNVSSDLGASTLGPGIPPVRLAGRTSSDTTLFALPTLAVAYLPEDSPFAFGLGLFALAGFGVDYPGSTTNPLLTAPAPAGLGLGATYSDFQALQIVPAISYRVTDRLSVAAGPTLTLATLRVEPGLFAAPDDANGDGFATYPAATHARTVAGGGFTLGVFYQADVWAVGASVKSPQWLDTFRFNSRDELGRPRQLTWNADVPMIVSVGASYTGLECWTFGIDVRYLDYKNADGVGDSGITPDGAVRGLGWRSIFAVALGAQYQVNDDLSLRAGYTWNQNPIPDGVSFINTVAPTIVENMVYAGLSYNVTDDFTLSVAYLHAFENSITGPLLTPAGAVPGTSVRNTASGDSLQIGLTVKFGGCRTPLAADCSNMPFGQPISSTVWPSPSAPVAAQGAPATLGLPVSGTVSSR